MSEPDDIEWWESPVTGGVDYDLLIFPLGTAVGFVGAFIVWVVSQP